MLTINTICVCGAGTMGNGIAQAAAQSGFYTILYELNPAALEYAKNNIEKKLRLLAEKGKIIDWEKIFQNIQFTNDIQNCRADVFIEAILEKTEIKVDLFNQLAELNHSKSIFATNTSSLSISKIAKQVKNPERLIGMHFFNPAPLMKLVEVVRTEYTNEDTLQVIIDLAKQMGKVPVVCNDSPGFIVNRVARPYYIESLRLIEERITNFSQLDLLMEATGFKMGPFRLMDLIGNDINYAVSVSVYEQLNSPERLRPSSIQKEKVERNELGIKTKKGYYTY